MVRTVLILEVIVSDVNEVVATSESSSDVDPSMKDPTLVVEPLRVLEVVV